MNDKQKKIIVSLSDGWFLYHNTVSVGPNWCLTKESGQYIWGNISSRLIKKIEPYITGVTVHFGVDHYRLNDRGEELATELKNLQ